MIKLFTNVVSTLNKRFVTFDDEAVGAQVNFALLNYNDFFPSILQAIACYTPKFLWDAFEGGLLQMIVRGLHLGICREEEKQAKKNLILDYLTSHLKVIFFIHF